MHFTPNVTRPTGGLLLSFQARRIRRTIATASAITVLCAIPISCSGSPTRSVAAFCDTFKSESIRLHDKYQTQADSVDPKENPLGGLLVATAGLVQAQGDFIVLFDKLDKVAPDDIEPDVAATRDAFKAQAETAKEALSNPLGALGKGLIGALQSSGSTDQVETYITANCDLSFQNG